MKNRSLAERIMYNTIRLQTPLGNCGTGSFFSFSFEDITVPIIVTNKHVVNYNPNEPVNFSIHLSDENGNPEGNFRIDLTTDWHFHSTQDLCFCYANPLFEALEKQHSKKAFYLTSGESIIYSDDRLRKLSAMEEVVMVGYPIGLWDEGNNLPIFRNGHTASHPGLDFNQEGIGLVDIACFPGSSGSPVFVMNDGSYMDYEQGSVQIGSRLILLGYLFAGPVYEVDGTISVQTIPTQSNLFVKSKAMVNLGYYVKAAKLLEFRKKVETDLMRHKQSNAESEDID